MAGRRVFRGFVPCKGCGGLEPVMLCPGLALPVVICRNCQTETMLWLCREAARVPCDRPVTRGVCDDCGRLGPAGWFHVGATGGVMLLCRACERQWTADMQWEE